MDLQQHGYVHVIYCVHSWSLHSITVCHVYNNKMKQLHLDGILDGCYMLLDNETKINKENTEIMRDVKAVVRERRKMNTSEIMD